LKSWKIPNKQKQDFVLSHHHSSKRLFNFPWQSQIALPMKNSWWKNLNSFGKDEGGFKITLNANGICPW
jgi:hypothetical protein